MSTCPHLWESREAPRASEGCAECIALGDTWVHLRLCLTCGNVGCCDQSANKHASAHFAAIASSGRPVDPARRGMALVLRRRGPRRPRGARDGGRRPRLSGRGGVPGRIRTCDPRVRSSPLCPLSYGDVRAVYATRSRPLHRPNRRTGPLATGPPSGRPTHRQRYVPAMTTLRSARARVARATPDWVGNRTFAASTADPQALLAVGLVIDTLAVAALGRRRAT